MWPFDQIMNRLNRGRWHAKPSPEALRAQQRATEGLRRDIERAPEVARVTESLRKALLRNHFSEAMEHLIVRGTPGERHQ